MNGYPWWMLWTMTFVSGMGVGALALLLFSQWLTRRQAQKAQQARQSLDEVGTKLQQMAVTLRHMQQRRHPPAAKTPGGMSSWPVNMPPGKRND